MLDWEVEVVGEGNRDWLARNFIDDASSNGLVEGCSVGVVDDSAFWCLIKSDFEHVSCAGLNVKQYSMVADIVFILQSRSCYWVGLCSCLGLDDSWPTIPCSGANVKGCMLHVLWIMPILLASSIEIRVVLGTAVSARLPHVCEVNEPCRDAIPAIFLIIDLEYPSRGLVRREQEQTG